MGTGEGKKRLQGRVAVVTGTGAEYRPDDCQDTGSEGCRVICNDVDLSRLKKVAQEINASAGTALAVEADITVSSQVKAMMEKGSSRIRRDRYPRE